MMRATWNGVVIAESDDTVVVDGYHYFPAGSVDQRYLVPSDHTSVCGWKGTATYFTIVADGKSNRDAAWQYTTPSPQAAAVAGRIAFWHGVKVTDLEPARRTRRFGWPRNRRNRRPAPMTPVPASSPGAVICDLTDATFEAGTEGGYTVVDFWAPWCGPCRAFHPAFEAAANTRAGSELRFARCDVDENPNTAAALAITSIPTVVLFDPRGNEIDRITGVPSGATFRSLLDLAPAARSC